MIIQLRYFFQLAEIKDMISAKNRLQHTFSPYA